jgi:transposase
LALVELSVVEQRCRAVLEVAAGVPVTEVADRFGVSRQSVHAWVRRYEQGGLVDRFRRPESCPHQVSVEVEIAVCELRREHPRWGPLRLAHGLGRAGVSAVPSRMSVYRVLVRHGLIEPQPRKRPRDSYVRWERDAPMALWQMDLVSGIFLADGTEAKLVTGVDDHSRFCLPSSPWPRFRHRLRTRRGMARRLTRCPCRQMSAPRPAAAARWSSSGSFRRAGTCRSPAGSSGSGRTAAG